MKGRRVKKRGKDDLVIAIKRHLKISPYYKLVRLKQARDFFDKFTPKEAKEFHRKFREL